jgi:hypothetical protein
MTVQDGDAMAQGEAGRNEIELRATTPDGTAYSVVSYTGRAIAGPGFVAVEPDSPRWARSLAGLVNRGLRLLPRDLNEEPFMVLYVFDGDGKQVCMVWAPSRADAELKAHQLVSEIEDGSFDPGAYENQPPTES